MVYKKTQLKSNSEYNNEGQESFKLFDLKSFFEMNQHVKLFSVVELLPGKEVPYHIHNGESENYYIISGEGLYNDNGEEKMVSAQTITCTSDGYGHGLKNIGKDILQFIALIIKD